MIYPIVIGLGVVSYMLYKEFDPRIFAHLNVTWKTVFWIFMAFVFMVGRDLGYMIRIRLFSDNKLTWRQAFRVIMLWEFTSAITPSAVGGTSVAIVYVHKEGISVGKSSAIVLLTSFFDELYFIVVFPLVLLIIGKTNLFDFSSPVDFLAKGLLGFVLVGYFIKLAYALIVAYGLFVNPRGLKHLIVKIFKLRFLRKWSDAAARTGEDIIVSSREFRKKDFRFWLGAVSSTFLSWSSRYLVVNALLLAFFTINDHFLLFARQLAMWIMMLVMPTPGGSGFVEYVFKYFMSDLIPVDVSLQMGAAVMTALMWRLVTYYPYLFIGAILFPRWIKRHFIKRPRTGKRTRKDSRINRDSA